MLMDCKSISHTTAQVISGSSLVPEPRILAWRLSLPPPSLTTSTAHEVVGELGRIDELSRPRSWRSFTWKQEDSHGATAPSPQRPVVVMKGCAPLPGA